MRAFLGPWRWHTRWGGLWLALILMLFGLTLVWGAPLAPTALADTVDAQGAPPPVIPIVPQKRKFPINRIYAYDASQLGDRSPVLLVPGRAQEYQLGAWWKRFYQAARRSNDFNRHFKLYVFVYNSTEPLHIQTHHLVSEFQTLLQTIPQGRPVYMINYSLGGVICREALEHPQVFERTRGIISMGVPFHGSPVFNPDWFSQYMNLRSPLRRPWDQMIYQFYMSDKDNLTQGLQWNNFDHSKPQFDAVALQGDQLVSAGEPYRERELTAAIKKKMVVYASVIENSNTGFAKSLTLLDIPFRLAGESLALPKRVLGTVLPVYGLTAHSVFDFMSEELSNLPTSTPANPEGKNTHLYRYNDGVIPLSSALYLPVSPNPYEGDLDTLKAAVDVKKARVFLNIDHVDLGEYRLNQLQLKTTDVFHPGEKARTPTQWILHDLENFLK